MYAKLLCCLRQIITTGVFGAGLAATPLAQAKKKPANGLRWDEWYAKTEGLYREIGETEEANKIAKILAEK